jgi:hypothetical protein
MGCCSPAQRRSLPLRVSQDNLGLVLSRCQALFKKNPGLGAALLLGLSQYLFGFRMSCLKPGLGLLPGRFKPVA